MGWRCCCRPGRCILWSTPCCTICGFWAGVVGLLTSVVFVLITMYYTESRWRPVQSIARASLRGSGPNIITGLAVGFENTAMPVIAVGLALLSTYWLGTQAASDLGVAANVAGIYGTAVATMGMLMTAAFVLAMDTFGPIVDNAGGIVEMSGAPSEIRAGTDALDAAGNTTKALTKGYAIGSAALAAFCCLARIWIRWPWCARRWGSRPKKSRRRRW